MTIRNPNDARSYARVARSTSTTFKEESATARRWTESEIRSRIEDAPPFRLDPPSTVLLQHLAQQYQDLTGDPVRTQRKRNFLAACYRVHGPDLVPLIRDEFATGGTARNLLGVIRCMPPRSEEESLSPADSGAPATPTPVSEMAAGHHGPPCPIERCLPGLVYCQSHQPPFDPTSRRRYDRRPSNPLASHYFVGDNSYAGVDRVAPGRPQQ